eukprot:9971853-Alexandrium_andersonii.AAC.1
MRGRFGILDWLADALAGVRVVDGLGAHLLHHPLVAQARGAQDQQRAAAHLRLSPPQPLPRPRSVAVPQRRVD